MKCMSCLKSPCAWIPQRYFFPVYMLIGLNIYYWIRVSVHLSLAAITFPLAEVKSNDTKNQYCPPNDKYEEVKIIKAEFHWNQDIQHLILQGFYYGHITVSIPGGTLADTFGGKSVVGSGYLLAAVVALVLPTLAQISPYCLFIGRVFQGVGEGVVFPGMFSMIAKWAPPHERSSIMGLIMSGIMLGNASGFIVTSFILASTPSWKDVYYINGVLGIVWVIGWYFFCYSSPALHPFVTDKERNMIQTEIARNAKKKPKRIPWKSILTSLPLLAAIIAKYGHLWTSFTMINEMPLYLSKVVNFDILHSGIFSATPHLAMLPSTMGAGYLCDWLIKREIMTITVNRKIFIFLASALPVPFLIAASLAGCDKALVVILFASMMFFKGLAYPTLDAQPVDLAPHYAGILMGIINTVGCTAGFVSPMVAPMFLTGDGSLQEWRQYFILTGCLMIASTLPFLWFGSAKVQPWNSEEEQIEEQINEEREETKESNEFEGK